MYSGVSCSHPWFPVLKEGPPRLLLLARFHLVAHPVGAEDSIEGRSIWNSLQSLLPDERERRLAYLLYYCGLKPRDIVIHCSREFDDVKEIYRLNHNIVERLRRNRDRLRHVLGDAE